MKIFCVGDVHGDLLVFVSALYEVGCVINAQEVINHCYKHKLGALNAPKLLWNYAFSANNNVVFIMGDVVDSKRGQEMPENIDNIEYSEEYMINTCTDFCRQHKHHFIHIIGNHEMACVVDTMHNEKYRSMYKCNNKVTSKLESRKLCKSGWKKIMRSHLLNFAKPLIFRSYEVDNQKCNLLFCHGGLDGKFIQFLKNEYYLPVENTMSKDFWMQVENKCSMFYKDVLRGKRKAVDYYTGMDYSPDWSRIHKNDNYNEYPFFHILVVGHSAEHMIKTKSLISEDKSKTIKVFTDMQLSRVFNEENNRDRYVFMFKPNLRRKVFENHKINFELLQLP